MGPTMAYTGKNTIQIINDPGIANMVHLVHKLKLALILKSMYLVIRAALPRTVNNIPVYSAIPHTQCPESCPSDCTPS
jgi:hypothetical protein